MQHSHVVSSFEKQRNLTFLKSEMYRLSSFTNYPSTATKAALLLAANGFVYNGDGLNDQVRCFFCGIFKDNWTIDSDVQDVHGLMSPNCPMVSGRECDNIPWISRACFNPWSMIGYETNLVPGNLSQENSTILTDGLHEEPNSFITHSDRGRTNSSVYSQGTLRTSNSVNDDIQESIPTLSNTDTTGISDNTASLAHGGNSINDGAGLRSGPQSTTTTVAHSNEAVSSSGPGPTATSTQNRSNASSGIAPQISNNGRSGSAPQNNSSISSGPAPTYFDLGIVTERPKRIEYALKQKRRETFEYWPRDHHLTPEDLSNAGFYYAGYGDCSRCFFCGGGLRNWEDEDDVWVEHARWFPKCAFMRQKVGQRFIDVVQDLTKEFEQISLQMVMNRLPTRNLQSVQESSLKSDPAVQAVVALCYREQEVLDIASSLKEQSVPLSADVILERLPREANVTLTSGASDLQQIDSSVQENSETIRKIKQSNNELRQRIVCKICLDQEVAVAFLPCGHLVSCTECSIAMRDCPLCRTNVKGIVRAFLN